MAKVLLVEESKKLNSLYRKNLENNEYEVALAFSVEEIMKALVNDNNNDIDVVFIDIMMSQVDGFELLEKIKKKLQRETAKICIHSIISEINKIKKCLSLGADDYLIKTSDEELMVNKVQFLLGELPRYEYSKIKYQHKESLFVDSSPIDIELSEVHEDYFVFKSEYGLDCGSLVYLEKGEIRDLMETSLELMARVFLKQRFHGNFLFFANYIGLTEAQTRALRSKTLTRGEMVKREEAKKTDF